jgi:hypothetical protein
VRAHLKRISIDERNLIPGSELAADGAIRIPCGNAEHRARIVGHALVLSDHDLDAELALLAFGSPVPTCVVHALVWREAFEHEGFLSDWADDVEDATLRATAEEWRGNYWDSWPRDPSPARVLFGPAMQLALALAVAQAWTLEHDPAADAARIGIVHKATQNRARRALVQSLASVFAHRRPDALVPVRTRLTDGPPSAAGRLCQTDSWIELALPLDWLWSVWRPGPAVVDEHFVLARLGGTVTWVVWAPTGGAGIEHVPHIERVRV